MAGQDWQVLEGAVNQKIRSRLAALAIVLVSGYLLFSLARWLSTF